MSVNPEQEDALKVGIELGHVVLEVGQEATGLATLVKEGKALTAEDLGAAAGALVLGLILPVLNLLAALEVYAPTPKDVADLLGDALTARFGDFGTKATVTIFFVFAIVSVDSVVCKAFSSQEQAEQGARKLNLGDSFIARFNTGSPKDIEVAAFQSV